MAEDTASEGLKGRAQIKVFLCFVAEKGGVRETRRDMREPTTQGVAKFGVEVTASGVVEDLEICDAGRTVGEGLHGSL